MQSQDEALSIIYQHRPKFGCENLAELEKLEKFEKYFFETWFGENAQYPPSLWNHYGTVSGRTTNIVEGWHNRLKNRLSRTHPTIAELLSVFRKEHFSHLNQSSTISIKDFYANLFVKLSTGELSLAMYLDILSK